jgi:pimeloyl-ACP methyl ester carboxylesterase
LVLLHGGHGSWLHWVRNIEVWSQRHAVWVPDMPGYGDSANPPENTLQCLVDVLACTLDSVAGSGTPIRLLGFSFGALVAANLASRRPGVLQLALFGPAGHGGPRRPRGELQAWRRLPTGSEAWLAVMRHNLRIHMLHDSAAIDDVAVAIHGDACLRTRFHSRTISRAGGLPAALHAFGGPLLLAWGEHDVTLDPTRMKDLLGVAARSNCRIETIPRAGHWVQYEQSALVNDLVLDGV